MTQSSRDLTLFVTGDAPRSRRARANLKSVFESLGGNPQDIVEVDLIAHPETALDQGIFATPALMVAREAGAASVMYGDLSDRTRLENFLIEEGAMAPGWDT